MSLADRTERVRLIKDGIFEDTLSESYLDELINQGFTVVKFPILPTGVMV